MTGKHIL